MKNQKKAAYPIKAYMIDIATTLTAAKTLYSGAQKAIELMNQINTLDKDEVIVELRKIIIQMNKDALTLIEENQELKRVLNSKMETYFEKGVFWGKDGSGPFCPKCIQQSPFNKVYITNNDPQEKESWKCPVCNGSFMSQEALQRVSFH